MSLPLAFSTDVTRRKPVIPHFGRSRRELLTLSAAGVAGSSLSNWLAPLASAAAEQSQEGRRHKSCVLLWMDGGPSQTDTVDPKPDGPAEVRGGMKSIATNVPGIRLSERLPGLAQLMNHAAILRGMSTAEADHGRARIYMHTGYRPGQGGVTYPGLGSTVSAEIGVLESALPNFVVTGSPLTKHDVLRDPGYRGPRHQPLVLDDVDRGLQNARASVPEADFNRRATLLQSLEQQFVDRFQTTPAEAHQSGIDAALRLMRSDRCRAFDLSEEPASSRQAYGNHDFGRGCLLARRLVEARVPFVEIYLSNWDSHEGKVAENTLNLMTQVDQGTSSLVRDLSDRGLLDDTLIIWMGEFGRTPRVNRNGGRDHYSKAWSTMLIGGGIRGGQVVGATDDEGREVIDRPVSVADFMATVCRILGIDHTREVIATNGRPIRIVDKNEQLVSEVLPT